MKLELPRFHCARVLVIGDIMLDRYWEGPTARISPEAPVPVVRVEQITDRPGGAGNVALNLAALGTSARLGGHCGDDEMADALQDRLAGAGVECAFSRVPGLPTITKLRVISRHQQLIRLDFEQPEQHVIAAPALQLPGLLDDCQALVLSDYAKGALARPQALIEVARQRGIPVMVDPKGADFARYRGATLLTPNLQELEAVVGRCRSESELVTRGERLMHELDLQALLVTRGEHGMTLLRPGQEELHMPARAREVYDVTGAGDTVIAVLGIADTLKDDAASAVAELHHMGLKTAMITGDNEAVARAIADQVGIDYVIAGVLPEGKVEEVQKLQSQLGLVAFVGDGINDAAALTRADVGIAIGSGTDIAIEASDVTLVRSDLGGVVSAIHLSRATFRKIRQNLFWAFFYNVAMIPLAVIGWMHPVLAEIAMAVSSVSVVGNANLLKRVKI